MLGLALDATSGARRLLAGLASPGASGLDTSLGALVRGQPLRWLVAAVVVAGAAVAAVQIADGALLIKGFGYT